MLSTPTPARPIILRFGLASITSLPSLVALRTIIASYSESPPAEGHAAQ